jgi:hypothetical protein
MRWPVAEESAMGASQPMFFEVHPSVLFKLGEDLIRDEGQALVELIKNSYDADAQTPTASMIVRARRSQRVRNVRVRSSGAFAWRTTDRVWMQRPSTMGG